VFFVEVAGAAANPTNSDEFQKIIWEELFVFIIDDITYEKIDWQ
jgi:hypothetical protein